MKFSMSKIFTSSFLKGFFSLNCAPMTKEELEDEIAEVNEILKNAKEERLSRRQRFLDSVCNNKQDKPS